jgi:pSer/pThr/pTyr-binding forkhead associated (FHA) protein
LRAAALEWPRRRSFDAAAADAASSWVLAGRFRGAFGRTPMADITLRVIDGADRGRVFSDLPTPITIGREEGNTIQLNDERISRYHVKIQEDQAKLILTDLDSTNGTKVNGEDVQLRILRFGDVISVGRSTLLVGSREQIARRLRELRGGPAVSLDVTVEPQNGNGAADDAIDGSDEDSAADLDLELDWGNDNDAQKTLHAVVPPELPEELSPGQAAQLCELLDFLHVNIRTLIRSVGTTQNEQRVTLSVREWQRLLDLQERLAVYIRQIGEPPSLNP